MDGVSKRNGSVGITGLRNRLGDQTFFRESRKKTVRIPDQHKAPRKKKLVPFRKVIFIALAKYQEDRNHPGLLQGDHGLGL